MLQKQQKSIKNNLPSGQQQNKNMITQIDIKIGDSYKLTRKLCIGSFSEIFHGINLQNNMEVAVKLEPVNSKHQMLCYEAKLYKYFFSDGIIMDKGIPKIYQYYTEGEYNIMVMDLLGPSLEDLFNICNRKFSLKTILMLAELMLKRIEYIHHRYILHRDIKPANFLIGSGNNQNKLYIIDFGLSKRYLQRDGTHIPYRENKNLTGTARYASINTHLGIEQCRRDDLESLGYVLMYFLRGSLPWQCPKANNTKEKHWSIMEKKISTPVELLCQSFPVEFAKYLNYCRNLRFDEKPDYNYCQSLFKECFQKEGYNKDSNFDWNKIEQKQ
ncbi:hypothetical protein ABPG74_012867 [Tetrahymena malaccensis]